MQKIPSWCTPPEKVERESSDIMKYFAYEHLPNHLLGLSREVHNLAQTMDNALPDNAEKAAGLRKLLEAKDCFVRARI